MKMQPRCLLRACVLPVVKIIRGEFIRPVSANTTGAAAVVCACKFDENAPVLSPAYNLFFPLFLCRVFIAHSTGPPRTRFIRNVIMYSPPISPFDNVYHIVITH